MKAVMLLTEDDKVLASRATEIPNNIPGARRIVHELERVFLDAVYDELDAQYRAELNSFDELPPKKAGDDVEIVETVA